MRGLLSSCLCLLITYYKHETTREHIELQQVSPHTLLETPQATLKADQEQTPELTIRKMNDDRIYKLIQRKKALPKEFHGDVDQETNDAKNLENYAAILMEGIKHEQSPLEVLHNLSNNINQHNLINYHSTSLRNAYALMTHKAGDCESICKFFCFIAWAAGHRLKQLEGAFTFHMVANNQIFGQPKDICFNFVSHTVIELRDAQRSSIYYDPLFGQTVNLSNYGEILAGYLEPLKKVSSVSED
ncbi:hypothetical protein ACFQDN_22895 [Pseudomonas asuensis]|uniref:Transglutaminase-like domain-containing protein n=1 Tax=Pseudomonas asuensis TaxID=1825787 RepID=A0ABQ2H5A1_9PSED|nr:hypothetical protein [Pseudomonas asuensis]GGM32842.1 hypothetical protein GCM10009425_49130 [Pseudomonas asuensis]